MNFLRRRNVYEDVARADPVVSDLGLCWFGRRERTLAYKLALVIYIHQVFVANTVRLARVRANFKASR